MCLSSILLHLLYNSAVFATKSAQEYYATAVNENFLNSTGPYSNFYQQVDDDIVDLNSTLLGFAKGADAWRNLTRAQCSSTYSAQLLSEYSNVLLVVDEKPLNVFLNHTFENSESSEYTYTKGWVSPTSSELWTFASYVETLDFNAINDDALEFPLTWEGWAYNASSEVWTFASPLGSSTFNASNEGSNGFLFTWKGNVSRTTSSTFADGWLCHTANVHNTLCTPDGPITFVATKLPLSSTIELYPLRYCLAQPVESHCQLKISSEILLIVVIINAIKAACLIIVAYKLRSAHQALITVGDAIQSFLELPDSTVKALCVANKDDFVYAPVETPSFETYERQIILSSKVKSNTWASRRADLVFGMKGKYKAVLKSESFIGHRLWFTGTSPLRW